MAIWTTVGARARVPDVCDIISRWLSLTVLCLSSFCGKSVFGPADVFLVVPFYLLLTGRFRQSTLTSCKPHRCMIA